MTTDDQPDGETRIVEGWHGRYDEDFEVGDIYEHPFGRTVTEIVTTELRSYNQNGDLVISLERTPMVRNRGHARLSAAKLPGWPDGIGTQPEPGS